MEQAAAAIGGNGKLCRFQIEDYLSVLQDNAAPRFGEELLE